MKALLINGSPHEHGCTFAALSQAEGILKKHDEGRQTMRTPGENMAWLLSGIKAGVPAPEYEPWVAANFIDWETGHKNSYVLYSRSSWEYKKDRYHLVRQV